MEETTDKVDGVKEDLTNGDQAKINGDQTVFWVQTEISGDQTANPVEQTARRVAPITGN